MITPAEIEDLILRALPGSSVRVSDMTGTGDHFRIEVVSETFRGKGLVDQHKILHEILAPEMESRIHAVQLKTRAA